MYTSIRALRMARSRRTARTDRVCFGRSTAKISMRARQSSIARWAWWKRPTPARIYPSRDPSKPCLRHSTSVAEHAHDLRSKTGQWRSANFAVEVRVMCNDDNRVRGESRNSVGVDPMPKNHFVGNACKVGYFAGMGFNGSLSDEKTSVIRAILSSDRYE
jgi:hypothetical protein